MRPDWTSAWAGARERLRRELTDPVFDAWIGPLTLESFDSDEIRIGATKPFVRNWVANHHVARIERALRAEGAEPVSISIVLSAPKPMVGGGLVREPLRTETPVVAFDARASPPRAEKCSGRACCIRSRPSTASWRARPTIRAVGGAHLRGRPVERHPAALHPRRFRLRQDASAERRGAGIPQARQAHAVPARRRFHAPFPGRDLSQGHARLQGRAAHRRSADHRRPAAHLPLHRDGVGVPLHRERLRRPAPARGDRGRPRAAGARRPGRRREVAPGGRARHRAVETGPRHAAGHPEGARGGVRETENRRRCCRRMCWNTSPTWRTRPRAS